MDMRKMLIMASVAPFLSAMITHAPAARVMDECHRIAADCAARGKAPADCQAQVDDCMSRHACEEVYLSCLELMEIDETVTEAACEQKRRECGRKRNIGK